MYLRRRQGKITLPWFPKNTNTVGTATTRQQKGQNRPVESILVSEVSILVEL